MEEGRLFAVGSCCVLLFCGCGGHGRAVKRVLLDRKTATGKHVEATASSGPRGFQTLEVRVTTKPAQRVTGSWAFLCREGTSSSRDADDFGGRSPLMVAVRGASTLRGSCTVVGTGKLTGSGRVRVELLGS